jgi:hypothetical protein
MPHRLCWLILAVALAFGEGAFAQTKIRTETIRPPAPASPAPPETPAGEAKTPSAPAAKSTARVRPADAQKAAPAAEIVTDLSRLPVKVARTRERILEAAQSGDLQKLLTVMQSSETLPVFSFSDDKDPVAYWKANYPDSDGIEVLSILTTVLQTGFVHVDVGTPQEMYLWPYFARVALKTLTPEQKVELFRIITGTDFKDMVDFGAYNFYRLGISPDGTWQFFVAGD